MNEKRIKICILIGLLTLLIGCTSAEDIYEQVQRQTDEAIERAQTFISLLDKGEFIEATSMFDQNLQKELPANELAESWEQAVEHFGAFIGQEFREVSSLAQYQVIILNGEFEHRDVQFEFSFDEDNLIAGFTLH